MGMRMQWVIYKHVCVCKIAWGGRGRWSGGLGVK